MDLSKDSSTKSKVQIKCTSCRLTWTCDIEGVLDKIYNARDVPPLRVFILQKQIEIADRVFEDRKPIKISKDLHTVADMFFRAHGSARDCYVKPIPLDD
jgi:hypothetical protein